MACSVGKDEHREWDPGEDGVDRRWPTALPLAVRSRWSGVRVAINNSRRNSTQMRQNQVEKKPNPPLKIICAPRFVPSPMRWFGGLTHSVLAGLGVTYFSDLIHIPCQKHVREALNHPVGFGLADYNNSELCVLCVVYLNGFESIRRG